MVDNTTAKIKSKGIELSALWKPETNFNIGVNYNFNDTYDGADCDDPDVGAAACIDSAMVRVPRHEITSAINYKINNNLNNKFIIKYKGETMDYGNTNNNFADVILDDFITLDYSANYRLYDTYDLFFTADNIFQTSLDLFSMAKVRKPILRLLKIADKFVGPATTTRCC